MLPVATGAGASIPGILAVVPTGNASHAAVLTAAASTVKSDAMDHPSNVRRLFFFLVIILVLWSDPRDKVVEGAALNGAPFAPAAAIVDSNVRGGMYDFNRPPF